MPTVLEANKWFLNTLVPWYTWANTHPDGICKTFVEYSAGITLPGADAIEDGNKYEGYVLDSDPSKPCGAGSFYCEGPLNGTCRNRQQSGTGYFWNGKSYGPFYRQYKVSSAVSRTFSGANDEFGRHYGGVNNIYYNDCSSWGSPVDEVWPMDDCVSYGGYQYLYGVGYDRSATEPDGSICQAKIKQDITGWYNIENEDELWWDRNGNP